MYSETVLDTVGTGQNFITSDTICSILGHGPLYLYLYYTLFSVCFKILERAERLREIDGILLPAFIRLQELVSIAGYSIVLFACHLR